LPLSERFTRLHLETQEIKQALGQTRLLGVPTLQNFSSLNRGQLALADYITSPRNGIELRQAICKVARGAGKTWAVATAYAYLHATDRTWKIFVHSGSFEQARYLYAYYAKFLRDPLLFPEDCFEGEPTRSLTAFKEGGFLKVLPASEKQSRGGHVDICSLDEVVLIKRDLIDAAIPTIRTSKRPTLVLTSTASPKISYRWFIDKWQNAETYGFKRFEWLIAECPWISDQVTSQLRKLFDSQTAIIELEGGIAELKGFMFAGSAIERNTVNPEDSQVWPLPLAPPATNWCVGVDWGFVHPTVYVDLEVRSDIAFVRDVRIREKELLSNVLEEIRTDYRDKELYAGNDGASEIAQLKAYGLRVESVAFSTDKHLLIGELKRRFERDLIKLPDPKQLEKDDPAKANEFRKLIDQLHQYHYDPDSGKAVKGYDDCVDALLYAMKPLCYMKYHGHAHKG